MGSIGNSTHQRYLNLSYLSTGYFLQFVQPKDIVTVRMSTSHHITNESVKLCHLDINGIGVKGMPTGFSKLKSLQMLTSFVISNDDRESKVSELG